MCLELIHGLFITKTQFRLLSTFGIIIYTYTGYREQWWLIGSSGGSVVVTPDCKNAVLGSNPAISPAYSGLPVLRWAAIWDGTSL
jgi:hypothetical protein